MEMGQFSHFKGYASEEEQSRDDLGAFSVSEYRCDAGLIHLRNKKYKLAALEFLGSLQFVEAGPNLGNNHKEGIAPRDVATYGALCALASFDRAELKSKIIENINFRDFVELVPEIRELIHDFYNSRYAPCLEYLGDLKEKLLLDFDLRDHVETLYDQIRKKALIQYIRPYVSVDLDKMANAFHTDVAGLEKELEAVIAENQIPARIDSQNKVLYARHADKRNETFQSVLQTGMEFDRDVRAMLLRASLLKRDHFLSKSSKD